MTQQNVTMKSKFDQELTPCGGQSERILEVAIEAQDVSQSFQRPPLNLALVIDRSGSMSGEKVEYVKQAARHVVGLLEKKDRVALVQYDNRVDVLFPTTIIDDESRPSLLRAISSIRTGGSTNLCDGWATGCNAISGGMGSQVVSHTLLLTDGLANVGITNPREIAMHAMEISRRGISTSTFGVGSDFDQNLLEDMANQGDGFFRFIESPADIPAIFKAVFKDLLTIVAHDVEITISYPVNVKVTLVGDYRTETPEPGKLRIPLGSLPAGRSKELYFTVSIPTGDENTALVFSVSLRSKDENGKLVESSSELEIRLSSLEKAEAAIKDKDLMERFAQVQIADRASAALKLEKEGKRQEASELLDTILATHRNRIDTDTHSRYQSMSSRMAVGMDELDRKRSHYDSYNVKQSQLRQKTFPIVPNAKGHIVFDVNGRLILLDTGSPMSFGNTGGFPFVGRNLHLPQNYMGVDTGYIGQMIGLPIEFLFGMDVIQLLYMQVDVKNGLIHFSEYPFPQAGNKVELEAFQGVPYTSILMNGKHRKVLVDSGAKIHYLKKEALEGLAVVDTEMDFYPYLGEFETQVYMVPLEIAGRHHRMRCGVLPAQLETTLAAAGADGIMGTELYNEYIVTFDFPKQCLWLDPYPD